MPDGSDAKRIRRPPAGGAPSIGLTGSAKALAAATHAYDDALRVGEGWAHRVDTLVSTPRTARQPPLVKPSGSAPEAPVSRVAHEIGKPYRTSFRFGFGFAAGAWTFRAILQLIVGAALIIAIMRFLASVIG